MFNYFFGLCLKASFSYKNSFFGLSANCI